MAKTTRRSPDSARRNTRMRFEQWAKNPVCEANTISAVRNVRMSDVANRIRLPSTFGQSPFAIIRGDRFERTLFTGDGKKLIDALIKKEVLPEGAKGFIDFRIKMNGGTRITSLDTAIEETIEFFRRVASTPKTKRKELPALAGGATVRIPKGVLLPEAILIIDALAIRTDGEQPTFYVGEIKVYPDRGGHTAAGELASARAQAGIYVHGLDLLIESLGLAEKIAVSREGFLVLTRPGSNSPSVRAGEDLRYQAERAKRGFELLERAARSLDKELWARETEEVPDELIAAVLDGETRYCENCLSFCDLAPRCFALAKEKSDPVILGEEVSRFVGNINLKRTVELMNGAKPRNDAEKDLVRRIKESERIVAHD